MTASTKFKIAVLDDYQNVALQYADWSVLQDQCEITVFNDHVGDSDAVIERLSPFDIVCVMRERTPLNAVVIAGLPNLKLIASTGPGNASIDKEAAAARDIKVVNTGYTSSPTIELTWALILAGARQIVAEANSVQAGGWQRHVGDDLHGKTLALLGLGKIGSSVAKIGQAFGMQTIAWSQNLTAEKAGSVGCELVSKAELFKRADVLSIHVVLSDRTRGLVGAADLDLMKPTARLINTSRGPIVVESDLIAALTGGKIAGASIDVFDPEPLPAEHFFRCAANVLATPHIGYVSKETYTIFYSDTVKNIEKWIAE